MNKRFSAWRKTLCSLREKIDRFQPEEKISLNLFQFHLQLVFLLFDHRDECFAPFEQKNNEMISIDLYALILG